jgi:SAM-dependent methyltransferase
MAKDLFSKQAAVYAQYRPTYPPALFDYILSFVTEKQTAWDCATGNGQAAVELARYFDQVMATDISEKQLQQAIQHEKITYAVSSAESTSFADRSFDCITVAQAYHWFDFDAFHKEVLRVAKPGAVIAVWGYSLVQCPAAALNTIIDLFYREEVGPYWDKERKHVDAHYATVAFPYEPLPGATFNIEVSWTLPQFIGYLNTWSSVQHYIKANGFNPVDKIAVALEKAWTGEEIKQFYFPLFLKLGRI